MKRGKFVILERNGEYEPVFKRGNSIIRFSNAYKTKAGALNRLEKEKKAMKSELRKKR